MRKKIITIELCVLCGILAVFAVSCAGDDAVKDTILPEEASFRSRVNSTEPVTLKSAVEGIVEVIEEKIVDEEAASGATQNAKIPIAVVRIATVWQDISFWLNQELTAQFSNGDKLLVVDKSNLDTIHQELAYQEDFVSFDDARRLGQETGAKYIINGELLEETGVFRLWIHVTDVEKATRILTPSRYIVSSDPLLKPYLDKEKEEKALAEARRKEEHERKLREEEQKKLEAQRVEQARQERIAEERARVAWKEKYLYFGVRGGTAIQVPNMSKDDFYPDMLEPPVVTAGPLFAGYLQIQPYDLMAIQVEAIYSKETIKYSGYAFAQNALTANTYDASFEQESLMIPVLLKFNGRPGDFMFSIFGGMYYTIPLSKTHYTSTDGNIDDEYDYDVPFGWTAGIEMGFKVGPGVLFLDARYAGDISSVSIKDADGKQMTVFQRRMAMITVGYELGLFGGRTYEEWY